MSQALHHHYSTRHYPNTFADVFADSADGYTHPIFTVWPLVFKY